LFVFLLKFFSVSLAITIDGSFGDWDSADCVSDEKNEDMNASLDINEFCLTYVHDQENGNYLYISYSVYGPIVPGDDENYYVVVLPNSYRIYNHKTLQHFNGTDWEDVSTLEYAFGKKYSRIKTTALK